MRRIVWSSTVQLAALCLVVGCNEQGELSEGEDEHVFRDAPRPVEDDLGPRSFGTVPNYSDSVCPWGTGCNTVDVDADGKDDLVRFDHFGVFGSPGTVSVAYSNGWNFGPMQPLASDFCLQGDGCMMTDVTGDGRPDLIRYLNAPKVELWVLSSSPDGFEAPELWGTDLCRPGSVCTAGDLDGDGVAELVAFRGSSDQKGSVLVYPGGAGPGAKIIEVMAGMCQTPDAQCRLGDVDADGRVDLVEFDRDPNSPSTRVALATDNGFTNPLPWAGDIQALAACPAGAVCELGDFNGDFAADIIATYPEAGAGDDNSCSGQCGGFAGACWCDEACVQYGDCCSDHASVCQQGQTCEGSCGGQANGCWCDEVCVQYGDCCSDHQLQCIDAARVQQIQVWPSSFTGLAGVLTFIETPCDPGERCWSADVTGDGRNDLITIDPSGLVELFPSRDRIDRMRDAAWRLSMLRSDFAVRQARWRAREIDDLIAQVLPVSPELAAALPDRFPSLAPAASPTPSDPALPIDALPGNEPWPELAPGSIDRSWAETRMTSLATAVQTEAQAILDAVPAEDSMVWTAEQRRWHTALGQVVAARTALYAPAVAVAASSRGVCHNGVLHDRSDEDGVLRAEGSYVARYFDAALEHGEDERVWTALPALTGIVEGMRCLSQPELAGLEAAFVEAVAATMQDLLDRGQPMLAELVWDLALPVELLLFDGVKHFATPQGWRLLQARIEAGSVVLPDLPDPGADFAAFVVEDSTSCSTIRCQLYKSAARATASGRLLSLDTQGVWLPDLTARERLRRSSLYPELLLDAMVDLRRLGEGDCALIELNRFNLTCKSQRTCEYAAELAALPNDLGLDLSPGDLGSSFTHFGTTRSDLETVNGCGSGGSGGGGAGPTACLGPQLRGHGGRFHPLDPELDRIMSCTLQSFGSATPTTEVVVSDLDFDPRCLLLDPPEDGGAEEEPPLPDEEPPEATPEALAAAKNSARQWLLSGTGAASGHGYDREHYITVIMSKTGATRAQVVGAMTWVANNPLSPTRSMGSHGNPTPLQTRTHLDDAGRIDDVNLEVNVKVFNEDLAALDDGILPLDTLAEEYMIRGMLHEATHMVLHHLSDQGHAPSIDDLGPFHHDITDILGLTRVSRSCDPNSSQCNNGCGFSDARMSRFQECLVGDTPTPIDRCDFAEDYCEDREGGTMFFDAGLGCGAPEFSFPPICALVNCDGTSDVASACCGGAPGGGSPPPYPFEDPNPGPHPGDPDGPYGGIPGGPGGIPFPPLPSLPGLP